MAIVSAWLVVLICCSSGVCAPIAESDRVEVLHDQIAEETMDTTIPFEESLLDFRKDFGHYPAGSNREITRQLFGLNPKGKIYAWLEADHIFDGEGNLLDQWLEPYRFTFPEGKPRLLSRSFELAHVIVGGVTFIKPYASLPKYTKTVLTRSDCYKIALAIRLLVQQRHNIPPQSKLVSLIFSGSGGHNPVIWDAQLVGIPRDKWGSPFIVKWSGDHVSVSSRHSSYIASESLP